jgi:hypothetical protein
MSNSNISILFAIFLCCASTNVIAEEKDKLIEELMLVTGTKESAAHMTDQVVQNSFDSLGAQNSDGEVTKIISGAFSSGNYLESISLELEKNYDNAKFSRLIKIFSSPLAQRMTSLEKKQPSNAELQQFITDVSKQPLSSRRIKLLRKMDRSIGASKLYYDFTFSNIETLAIASATGCPIELDKISKELIANKSQFEKASVSYALAALAYTFRDVTDKDLSAYIDIYSIKDVRWFQGVLNDAVIKEYKLGIETLSEEYTKFVIAKKASLSMFTPKCGDKPDIFLEDESELNPKSENKLPT